MALQDGDLSPEARSQVAYIAALDTMNIYISVTWLLLREDDKRTAEKKRKTMQVIIQCSTFIATWTFKSEGRPSTLPSFMRMSL